ncbi:hypothetical protein [Massilia sp. GCM10023247]|uniref:hypothetical protein n=1 Tax=Massilia sp. GCM10023247 TaxID=3252643 RepID=UPI0036118EA1
MPKTTPAVEQSGRPCKEAVRAWLRARRQAKGPPPGIEQIRRELGWEEGDAGAAIVRRDDARARRLPEH